MKIAIGCDEAALNYKNTIRDMLTEQGIEMIDFGTYDEAPVLYPDIAVAVGEAIVRGEAERGILLCGTGIGMSISANKIPGIRAAVCHDSFSAERSRKSNDAQIICMGARVIGIELAKQLVMIWLHSDFAGGGSTAKVEQIKAYERKYMHL
ncbi:MAG: ribose 5-phosphate isomerase B [Clostridiaceae bacterium]